MPGILIGISTLQRKGGSIVLVYPVDYDGQAYIDRLPNAPSTPEQELIKSF